MTRLKMALIPLVTVFAAVSVLSFQVHADSTKVDPGADISLEQPLITAQWQQPRLRSVRASAFTTAEFASQKRIAQSGPATTLRDSPQRGGETLQIICEGGKVVHGRWIPCVCPAGHIAEGGPLNFRCMPRLRAPPGPPPGAAK
jgi:hypothetical protein